MQYSFDRTSLCELNIFTPVYSHRRELPHIHMGKKTIRVPKDYSNSLFHDLVSEKSLVFSGFL